MSSLKPIDPWETNEDLRRVLRKELGREPDAMEEFEALVRPKRKRPKANASNNKLGTLPKDRDARIKYYEEHGISAEEAMSWWRYHKRRGTLRTREEAV